VLGREPEFGGIARSMGSVGDSFGNALAERFFALLLQPASKLDADP
jgi:hypothetical protein